MKTKHQFKCTDELWKKILIYKIDNDLSNNNETLIKIIMNGLAISEWYK